MTPAEALMAHVQQTGHDAYAVLTHFDVTVGECYVCGWSTDDGWMTLENAPGEQTGYPQDIPL